MEITEFAEDFIEQCINCESSRPGVRSHFAEHDCAGISILVSNEIASAESITFFPAKNQVGRFLKSKPPCFFLGQVTILFLNCRWEYALIFAQLGPDILESR